MPEMVARITGGLINLGCSLLPYGVTGCVLRLRDIKVFRDNQVVQERIMDSNDLERERGITILSKNTSITYKDTKINIIDTPGHSDFGGEVERVLNMVEGVLLVVDSVEGPMPQTRFVLKKALEFGHAVVVVVNKIDRPSARADFVINSTFELFIELNASDEQCDFQVIYASGIKGKAGLSPDNLAEDLGPLFESIIRCIPGPHIDKDGALQMLATNIEYDEHKGRIAIGRLHAGVLQRGMDVRVCTTENTCRYGRIGELFVYEKFNRVAAQAVEAGDICAVCGIDDIQIGETIADKIYGKPLPAIKVEEPTVKMAFAINTSPFVGREGKYVTSRNLRDRLYREVERNLAMRVEDGETADTFIISGRGTLHITILIENMRREGYEFMVGPPKVINKRVDDKLLEPFEVATVEVPEEHMGPVVELLGKRRGQMFDMQGLGSEGTTLLKYKIPTRGLLGLRNAILTASRGTAILNTIFDSYGPWAGDISTRDLGSLVSSSVQLNSLCQGSNSKLHFEDGTTSSYALSSSQERGQLFVAPGVDVYKGQIVGIHQRPGDLSLNVCKKKAATNVRSNKEQTVVLDTPLDYSLDDCIEYIQEDELVEVTPRSIRMCKNPKIGKKTSIGRVHSELVQKSYPMAKKNVRGKNKSNDESLKKNDRSSNIGETDKDTSSSGVSERVSKPRKTSKRGENADENSKGKKLMVRGRKVMTDETTQERKVTVKNGTEKRKVMADEGKAEMGISSAKRSTNAENDKGKRISGVRDWVLKPHNPREGNGNIGEKSKGKRILGVRDWVLKPHNPREGNGNNSEKSKGKGKGKIRLVVEEGNVEESKILGKRRRNADKEIAESRKSFGENDSYNLRARKAIPSFQRVRLSENGFSWVVGKRVKVFKSRSKKWFTGEVKSYDDKNKLHEVLYVNGELEELDLKTQRFNVEVMPGEASTLSSKHKPSAGESSRKVVPKEETIEKVKGRKSKKKNSRRGLCDEETYQEWNMVILDFVKVHQKKKLVNAKEKMATKSESQKGKMLKTRQEMWLARKKVSDGVSNEKSKSSKKTKKDEGKLNAEKRENSAKKGWSNSKRK
ncbi:elongation factor family protein [Actinidia rufa]|uniref:Elongation factor family protein n=1 Tax=Actinidia rufa TaxID=165716 RepID=A0A7J0FDB7_9ERIC|nr:elongation factor family protein [Actinidia rufa]